MIDRFDFPHFHEPILNVFSRGYEHAMTVVLSLTEDSVQVFDASHNADRHFSALGRRLRARVQRGTETFADFLHSRLQLVSLEEDDEHRFIHLVTLRR